MGNKIISRQKIAEQIADYIERDGGLCVGMEDDNFHLDDRACEIIISLLRSYSKESDDFNEQRLARLASILHGLGERPILELFLEMIQYKEVDPGRLMARLETYATIDRESLIALGGDKITTFMFPLDGDKS